MRAVIFMTCLVTATLTTGCIADRKPYANNPLLLYYKPTLSDSETVLAERETRGGPTQPPMPTLAADMPRDVTPFAPPKPLPANPVLPAKAELPAGPTPSTLIQPIIRQSSGLSSETRSEPRTPLYSELEPVGTPAPQVATAETFSPPSVGTTPTVIENLPPVAANPKKPIDSLPLSLRTEGEKRTVPGRYGHDAGYRWLQGVIEKNFRGHDYIRYCDPSIDDEYGGKFIIDDPRLGRFNDGDMVAVAGELAAEGAGERNRKYVIHDVWLVKAKQ